jgi:hypothetical protein
MVTQGGLYAMKRRYLFVIVGMLLCGTISERPPAEISYTIKVTSALADKEVDVEVQEIDLEGNSEPVTTEHTTPFEISAKTGEFSGVLSRLSGAAEIQVDVYCEGCAERRVL